MTIRARSGQVNHRVVALLAAVLLPASAIGCTDGHRASDQPVITTTTEAAGAMTTPSPPNCDGPSTCTTRQLADAAGVTFGTAVDASHLDEMDYRTTLVTTFNSVTPENELKWASIHPAPDKWNFGPADRIIDFAKMNHLQVKGHNLIWDQESIDSTPEWVLAIDDPTELRAAVTDHIRTVMKHYRSAVDRWDVVNEPLQTLGADLYDNHFRRVLGNGYIAEMFAIAHEADPAARLFLNEATVELLPGKATALVALVEGPPRPGHPDRRRRHPSTPRRRHDRRSRGETAHRRPGGSRRRGGDHRTRRSHHSLRRPPRDTGRHLRPDTGRLP